MKKINSSVKFLTDSLKFTIGTIDKKNPKTFYIEMNMNISPRCKKYSYDYDIVLFKKGIYGTVRELISKMNDERTISLDKSFILDVNVAKERIQPKKKSYMTCQIYFKQNRNASFQVIVDTIKENMHNIETQVIENLNAYGFVSLGFKDEPTIY